VRSADGKTTNVVICGVGGQGIILASDVLCQAACGEGLDVKKSEVHGMAQRGGSVITHVRLGPRIYSPLIEEGTADFMLAFERLEALRYAHYLRKNGRIVVDRREIPPMTVLVGEAQYPPDIDERLKTIAGVRSVDAGRVALELGNTRVVNIVLLGVLANFLDLKNASWISAIRSEVKKKFLDLNIAAFESGRKLAG
jgi:indolepyruvate ferredoxin oxidoreductase beta subunit